MIFKTFFSRKGNEKYLIDFLNALLQIEIEEIKIQEEVNLEKLSTMEKGGRYQDYPQVIMINILDFNLFTFEEYVSNAIIVLDKHRDYKIDSIVETYYIELPKFRESKPDMNDKLNQWLSFLDDENKEEIEMAEKKNEILKDAKIELGYLTGEEEVRRLAELRDKWESDWNSSMECARVKGKEEGKAEGKSEKQKEIAKAMLDEKIPIKIISKTTGLTEEEIEKLKTTK